MVKLCNFLKSGDLRPGLDSPRMLEPMIRVKILVAAFLIYTVSLNSSRNLPFDSKKRCQWVSPFFQSEDMKLQFKNLWCSVVMTYNKAAYTIWYLFVLKDPQKDLSAIGYENRKTGDIACHLDGVNK